MVVWAAAQAEESFLYNVNLRCVKKKNGDKFGVYPNIWCPKLASDQFCFTYYVIHSPLHGFSRELDVLQLSRRYGHWLY